MKHFLFLALLIPAQFFSSYGQGNVCITEFSVEAGAINPDFPIDAGKNDTAIISSPSENQDLVLLYTIIVENSLLKDPYTEPTDTNSAQEYMNFSYDAPSNRMDVVLSKSMFGLVDYDPAIQRQSRLDVTYYFEFADKICGLLLSHELQDENTQNPKMEFQSYSVDIREDYLPEFNILGFQPGEPRAVDFDAALPNNQFTVTIDNDCPVKLLTYQYETMTGTWADLTFQLKRDEDMDYDTRDPPYEIYCDLLLEDSGAPSLNSSANLTISITPYDDEPPFFTRSNYQGYIPSVVEGTVVYIDPCCIAANDADVPPSTLEYSMVDADPAVEGSQYFAINSTTGSVTIIKMLDQDFLGNSQVTFNLTVSDNYGNQESKASVNVLFPTDGSIFSFERQIYSAQSIDPELGEMILQLYATGTTEPITYQFDPDYVTDATDFFLLNGTSGFITTSYTFTPVADYWLKAIAETATDTTNTMVNIVVTHLIDSGLPFVTSALFRNNITETDFVGDTGITVQAQDAQFYCIEAVSPVDYEDVISISPTIGSIYLNGSVDADNPNLGSMINIRVASFLTVQPSCPVKSMEEDLARNEAMAVLNILDKNDNIPISVDANGNAIEEIVIIAYPEDATIQRAKGEVATAMASDGDITSTLTYSLREVTGSAGDSGHFVINSDTGNIYLSGAGFPCSDRTQCTFEVLASDGLFKDVLRIQVNALDIDNIYTITMNQANPDDMDQYLLNLSSDTNTTIGLVYSTVSDSAAKSLQRSHERDGGSWLLDVHVYAMESSTFLTMAEFNNILSAATTGLSAVQFTERSEFTSKLAGGGDDIKGYKIATGILGLLVGLVIVAALVLGGMKINKNRKDKNAFSYKHPKPQVNEGFSRDSGSGGVINTDTNETFSTIFVDNYSTVSSTGKSKQSLTNSTRFPQLTTQTYDPPTSAKLVTSVPPLPDNEKIISYEMEDKYNEDDSKDVKRSSLETSEAVAEVHIENMTDNKVEESTNAFSSLKGSPVVRKKSVSADSDDSNSEFNKEGSYSLVAEYSNYLDSKVPDSDDEVKSVAFKVLVDTAEFVAEHAIGEDHVDDVKL